MKNLKQQIQITALNLRRFGDNPKVRNVLQDRLDKLIEAYKNR